MVVSIGIDWEYFKPLNIMILWLLLSMIVKKKKNKKK